MLAGPSALWGDGLGTVAVLWGEPGGVQTGTPSSCCTLLCLGLSSKALRCPGVMRQKTPPQCPACFSEQGGGGWREGQHDGNAASNLRCTNLG